MAAREDIALDPASLIREGVVASVDLAAARCTMRIGDPDEEEIETPPLRWLNLRAGATRVWSPPTQGEAGLILCPEGEIAVGIVLSGLSYADFPPAGSALEEIIAFGDGARIAYDPEGHVLTAELPGGSTVNVTCDQLNLTGDAAITGNVAIDGDLTVTGTVTAETDVVGGGKSLKGHKHLGVTAGGGVSGVPQ
jgi:phage baseplate assembly protein V